MSGEFELFMKIQNFNDHLEIYWRLKKLIRPWLLFSYFMKDNERNTKFMQSFIAICYKVSFMMDGIYISFKIRNAFQLFIFPWKYIFRTRIQVFHIFISVFFPVSVHHRWRSILIAMNEIGIFQNKKGLMT